MSAPTWLVDENNNLRPPAERDRLRNAQRHANNAARHEIESRKPARTKADGVRDYIETLKDQLATALPRDRDGLRIRIRLQQKLLEEMETKEKEARRAEKYANDSDLLRARESATALLRTPPPHANADAVARAHAFAFSDAWDDPKEAARAYWQANAEVMADAYTRQDREAADAALAADKANLDAARAGATRAETALSLHRAKELASE